MANHRQDGPLSRWTGFLVGGVSGGVQFSQTAVAYMLSTYIWALYTSRVRTAAATGLVGRQAAVRWLQHNVNSLENQRSLK